MPSQIVVQSGVITFQTVFTSAWAKVLTVPFAHMLISKVHIGNSSSKPATIRIAYVHPSASPNVNNSVAWDFVVAANNIFDFGDGVILDRDWGVFITSTQANVLAKSDDNVLVKADDPNPDPLITSYPIITFLMSAYALAEIQQP